MTPPRPTNISDHVVRNQLVFLGRRVALRILLFRTTLHGCTYAENVLISSHEDHSTRQCRCRHQNFSHRIGLDQFELGSGADHVDLPIFTGQIEQAVGGDRRGAVGATRGRHTLAMNSFTRAGLIAAEDSHVGNDVEGVVIDNGRGGVRPTPIHSPRQVPVALARNVPLAARPNSAELPPRRAPSQEIDHPFADYGRGNLDVGIVEEPPQLLAGIRIGATEVLGRAGNELGTVWVPIENRSCPGRVLISRLRPNPVPGNCMIELGSRDQNSSKLCARPSNELIPAEARPARIAAWLSASERESYVTNY